MEEMATSLRRESEGQSGEEIKIVITIFEIGVNLYYRKKRIINFFLIN